MDERLSFRNRRLPILSMLTAASNLYLCKNGWHAYVACQPPGASVVSRHQGVHEVLIIAASAGTQPLGSFEN